MSSRKSRVRVTNPAASGKVNPRPLPTIPETPVGAPWRTRARIGQQITPGPSVRITGKRKPA